MADVQALLQQYKVQFEKASQKIQDVYQNAPQHIESVKNKVADFQPTVQGWLEAIQNSVKHHIVDMTPVGTDMAVYQQILEIYTLTAVALFVSSIGYVIGSTFLGWLIAMFFSTHYAFYLGLVILPFATMYYIQKNAVDKEDRNITIIASAFFSGLLLGSNLSERYLAITSPPMFILPLVMGMSSVFLGPNMGQQPRSTLLGASLGAAVGIYFAFGLVTGNLGVTYFIWMILLAGAAFFDYQMKLAYFYDGSYGIGSHAVISIMTFLATGFFLTCFLSSSSPPAD